MQKVNIHEKLNLITDQWNPRIVGEMNNQQVRLVKLQGHDFEMHNHPEEELFFIVNGTITLEFEKTSVQLNKGEFYIVPRGVYHRPVCDEEAEVMLFVAAENINTGNIENGQTLDSSELEKL
jgi:mannose-6-phosphate isomerase-like protein (cupin superfamily)